MKNKKGLFTNIDPLQGRTKSIDNIMDPQEIVNKDKIIDTSRMGTNIGVAVSTRVYRAPKITTKIRTPRYRHDE